MNGTHGNSQVSAGKSRNASADLQSIVRQGLAELVLFLLVSTLFFCCRHADLLTPLAESARQILGCPPPPMLITLAVTGYTISAAINIINRAAVGERPLLKWSHLFYRTVFYLFYAFAGALPSHFFGVFVAGLILFVLDHMNLFLYAQKTAPGKVLLNQ